MSAFKGRILPVCFYCIILLLFCQTSCSRKDLYNINIDKNAPISSPPSAEYRLVWEENFDGKVLDTSRWSYYIPEGLLWRQAYYSPRAVKLDGQGHLSITTFYSRDSVITGMISTKNKFDFKNGYIEANVKLQNASGQWSAFWLHPYSFPDGGSSEQYGAEIDIFEYFKWKGDRAQHDVFWSGYGKGIQSTGVHESIIPNLQSGYHTFGLEWSPTQYLFTIDGHRSWGTSQGISGVNEFIILSMEVASAGGGVINRSQFPDSVTFDYIKVYKK